MNRKVSLRVRDLHAHLTCYLCDGYFIDATTIIECLHSFCRTCIVRYLTDHKCCPICNVQVHKTRPLLNIRSDQTLQEIVYVLVPDLRKNEMKRRRDFWNDHKLLKQDVLWSGLTPEELGETDELSARKSNKKLCLTIEPFKRRSRKLDPDSDWTEIDKEMGKRYLRCSQDVTVHHLHKLIRMKFKEPEHVEVLLFCGDSIIPQKYTLGDVSEMFPCPMNRVLELKYGLYVSKSTKRKRPTFWDNVDVARLAKKVATSPSVKKETPKLKKPLSATPQLKAFFNSVKNSTPKVPKLPPKLKPEVKAKPSIMDNSSAVENREDHAKIELLSMVQLKTVDKNTPDCDEERKETKTDLENVVPAEIQSPNKQTSTNVTNGAGEQQQLNNNHKNGASPPTKRTSPGGSKAQDATARGSKSANVKCYERLDIPVAEAVRRKPPTPVEVPEVVSKIVERPALLNGSDSEKISEEAVSKLMPFVQRKSPKREIRDMRPGLGQPRANRRKPTNPTQYPGSSSGVNAHQQSQQGHPQSLGQLSVNKRPANDEYVVLDSQTNNLYETVRINQTPKGGQFILLAPHGNNGETIGNRRSLPTQHYQQQSQQQRSQPAPSGNNANGLRRIEPHPSNHIKPVQNGKKPGTQDLSNLSNAAAHRAALDAVRNTMSGVKLQIDKKQAPPKRPILPKSTPSFSPLVVTGMDGIPQVRHGGPTRNIFQNEKVTYPMGHAGSQPNPRLVSPNVGVPPQNRQPQAANKRAPVSIPPRNETSFKSQTPRNGIPPFNTSSPSVVSVYQGVNGRGQSGTNTSPAQSHLQQHTPQQQQQQQQQRVPASAPASANSRPFVQTASKALNQSSSSAIARTNLLSHSNKRFARQMTAQTHNRNENNHLRPPDSVNSELLRAAIMGQRGDRASGSSRGSTSYMDQRIGQALAQAPKPQQARKPSPSKDPYQQTTIERTKAFVQSLSQQQQNHPPSSSAMIKTGPKYQRIAPHPQNSALGGNKVPPNMRPNPIEAAKLISQIKESQRMLKTHPGGRSTGGSGSRSGVANPMKRPHQRDRPAPKNAPNFQVATPPAGTKSPWASRAYPPPPDAGAYSESEYQPPMKKTFSQPPKAHQQPQSPGAGSVPSPGLKRTPVAQSPSSDMVPLELTSRSRRMSQSSTSSISSSAPTPPANPAPSGEQPLCLVVKKA